MIFTAIATALASLAITAGGITFDPFIRGMESAGQPVLEESFIGLRWDCKAGGWKMRNTDEICFAGLSPDGLVTGP